MPALETRPAPTDTMNRPFESGNGTVDDTPRHSRLWLWFVAAFVLQIGAWAAWFVVASHHRVAEVPLAETVRGAR